MKSLSIVVAAVVFSAGSAQAWSERNCMMKCQLTATPGNVQLCQTRNGGCARFVVRAAERSDLEDQSERLLGRLNVRRQDVRRPDMAHSAGPVHSTRAFGGILLAIRH